MTEVLTQKELDQILDAIKDEKETLDDFKDKKIILYNFRKPEKFSKENIRVLQLIHEKFTCNLNAAFRKILKKDFNFSPVSVFQVPYNEFMRMMSVQCFLAEISINGYGNFFIEIDEKTIFFIINLFFDGDENWIHNRKITELSKKLMEQPLAIFKNCLKNAFSGLIENNFKIENIYSYSDEVNNFLQNEIGIGIIFTSNICETTPFTIYYPQDIFKLLKKKLNINYYFNKKGNIVEKNNINVNLNDVMVELSVELGRKRMIVKDILQLGEGSIIELDSMAGEPVSIFANNKLIAKGETVIVDENFGVRVSEICS